MPKLVYLLLFALAANPIASQTEGHHELGQQHSPYADQESSGIAALSLSELGGLQDGAGMGLARAAELNHYPGPKHVLQLAAELNLSEKQSAEVEELRLCQHLEANLLHFCGLAENRGERDNAQSTLCPSAY